jgi:ATP synthase subunit 6
MKFYSPLEQFEILPIFNVFGFFTITNQFIALASIVFCLIIFFISLLKPSTQTLYMIPNRWQSMIEILYILILGMVLENIEGEKNHEFFPLILTIFIFVASMNLFGLIPYCFTVTSHFIVTLSLSLSIFIGINIISIRKHKLKFFGAFMPQGTSIVLGLLLVPVEFISYIFKPLSLAIRLFCNMMAGHTLLKVFAGFAWSLMNLDGIISCLQIIPLMILVPLYCLEFAVALIQAYVFSLLTCMYINDAVNLH